MNTTTRTIPVGTLVLFGTKTGEVTAINRSRYVVLASDGHSYTVPFSYPITPLADQSAPKPTDSIPTIRTFRIGDAVVTHSPGSKLHGMPCHVIKINTATIKVQPDNGTTAISGVPNLFRLAK